MTSTSTRTYVCQAVLLLTQTRTIPTSSALLLQGTGVRTIPTSAALMVAVIANATIMVHGGQTTARSVYVIRTFGSVIHLLTPQSSTSNAALMVHSGQGSARVRSGQATIFIRSGMATLHVRSGLASIQVE